MAILPAEKLNPNIVVIGVMLLSLFVFITSFYVNNLTTKIVFLIIGIAPLIMIMGYLWDQKS